MHSLIWNRVVLILTDSTIERQVIEDDDKSIAIVIPFTQDIDDLVHFLHAQVLQLEMKYNATNLISEYNISEPSSKRKHWRKPRDD